MKVLHVITDLNGYGGTEKTLLRYLSSAGADITHIVFVLKSCGTSNTAGAAIRQLGVEVHEFRMHEPGELPLFAFRFLWRLRAERPDVIFAWLYHPIFLVEIFRTLAAGRPRIVWHIRSLPSYAEGAGLRNALRRWFLRCVAALSRRTDAPIAANSRQAILTHQRLGYRQQNWHLVPNGIDSQSYRFDSAMRREMRRQLGVSGDEVVLIAIGRFVPEKGYPYLFEAIAQSQAVAPLRAKGKLRFLGLGEGISEENPTLLALCAPVLPQASRMLVGRQEDVRAYLAASDIFVQSSVSESFPNALLEAMASGVPVVATRVGGVADLDLDARVVAEPGDAAGLARAIDLVLSMSAAERSALTAGQQDVVRERYSTAAMNKRFDELVFDRARSPAAPVQGER